MDGSQVESYVNEGWISEVAAYCESDVVNTYRIWLIYQCFLGLLTPEQLSASEAQLDGFLTARTLPKPTKFASITSISISQGTTDVE
jgi:hypothetical protein